MRYVSRKCVGLRAECKEAGILLWKDWRRERQSFAVQMGSSVMLFSAFQPAMTVVGIISCSIENMNLMYPIFFLICDKRFCALCHMVSWNWSPPKCGTYPVFMKQEFVPWVVAVTRLAWVNCNFITLNFTTIQLFEAVFCVLRLFPSSGVCLMSDVLSEPSVLNQRWIPLWTVSWVRQLVIIHSPCFLMWTVQSYITHLNGWDAELFLLRWAVLKSFHCARSWFLQVELWPLSQLQCLGSWVLAWEVSVERVMACLLMCLLWR